MIANKLLLVWNQFLYLLFVVFLLSLELLYTILYAFNVELELVLDADVLPNVGFQLPHDLLVDFWRALDAGKVGSL